MDVDELICQVYMRPALWDRRNRSHHNRFILDKLWDEVAFKLSTSRIAARNKWKALRDKYRNTLTILPKADATYKISWAYYESLQFLKDQFALRESSGNLSINTGYSFTILEESQETVEENNEQNEAEQIELSETNSPATSRTSLSPQNVITKTRKRRSAENDIGEALLDTETKEFEILEDKRAKRAEEDEDLHFFKSVLPHIKHFSPIEKMSYRMRILQITQEFLNQANRGYVNSNSVSRNPVMHNPTNNLQNSNSHDPLSYSQTPIKVESSSTSWFETDNS